MRIYEFVREHVMPFNAVIVMSISVVGVLDFLAPQAPYLAWVSYALAGLVLMAMVLELRAQRPSMADSAWYIQLLDRLRAPPGPLWKSPAWQVIGIIAVIALVLGQASKAQAESGGLIAGAAPNLRNVQVLLLGLQEDTRRIQTTLDGMAPKVDSIHASVATMEGMMKEPRDYLAEGDYPYLQKLVASGKRLPRDTKALVQGLNQKRPDRFDLLELYTSHEFDILQPVDLSWFSFMSDDVQTINNMAKLNAWTQKRFKLDAVIPLMSCRTMDLLAYSYIAGDKPLTEWLVRKGVSQDAQYSCEFASTLWTVTTKDIKAVLSP